jgi:hypothetical protein
MSKAPDEYTRQPATVVGERNPDGSKVKKNYHEMTAAEKKTLPANVAAKQMRKAEFSGNPARKQAAKENMSRALGSPSAKRNRKKYENQK